jgi:transposase InsO family protein
MGQLLHKRATTTHRLRAEIQASLESAPVLAERYNVNIKTIYKWRKRDTVEDDRMGSKTLNTVLSEQDESVIRQFRKSTGLPLDDCLISLQPLIPKLTRSNLYRCLKRHGLATLPKADPEKREKKPFKSYPIGYVHIDISQVQIGKKKFYLFVAIERLCKFSYVELHEVQSAENAVGFLERLVEACPFKIHTILTDNGTQFTYAALANHLKPKRRRHPFDRLCYHLDIRHRLTEFRHPWTNGQVEKFNDTLKKATTKTYHYETVEELKNHLYDFVMAYNYNRKLKSLKFKTPYEKIGECYQKDPALFRKNPNHYLVGLNR